MKALHDRHPYLAYHSFTQLLTDVRNMLECEKGLFRTHMRSRYYTACHIIAL